MNMKLHFIQTFKLLTEWYSNLSLDTAFKVSENEYEVHTSTEAVQDSIMAHHQTFLRTVVRDLRTLFKMSTLEEVVVTGRWVVSAEVKRAVLCSLQEQS